MQKKEALYLLDSYLEGKSNPEEKEKIELWYKELQEEYAWDLSAAEEATVKQRLKEAIDRYRFTDENAAQPIAHRVHFLKTSWFRYAAAIILMLGAGSYLWFTNRNNNVATTNDNKHLKTDILPGGDRAVLTLADGSKIILDSTANGNIAQQGGTRIIKLTKGQLAYSATTRSYKGGQGGLVAGELLYNTISTPRGGQYQIVLPDGTKVWLNAASSIRFPTAFVGTERNVNVTGEVYMEVAKNLKQPFRVNAGGAKIEVLGTSFNINAYADESSIKTTLIEGAVAVSTDRQPKGESVILKSSQQAVVSADRQPKGESVILKSSQQAVVSADRQQMQVQATDVDEAIAWKNGFFHFDKADVRDVMRQLARWYDLEVSYEPGIPALRFGGDIKRDQSLSGVLKILEKNQVHFSVDGKKIIVMP